MWWSLRIVIQQYFFEKYATPLCLNLFKVGMSKISVITKQQNVLEKISSDLVTLTASE